MSLVVGVDEIYCEVLCQCVHLVSGHRTLLTCDTQHVYVYFFLQMKVRARMSVTIGPIEG